MTYITISPDLAVPTSAIQSEAAVIRRAVSGGFSTSRSMAAAKKAVDRLRAALDDFNAAYGRLEIE